MRGFVILTIAIGALRALDVYAFKGRYSQAAWREANSQGQKFNYELQYYLKKKGL